MEIIINNIEVVDNYIPGNDTTSAGPFVILFFLFVKIDLATDSGSEYYRDEEKIGFHFFLQV